MISKHNSHLILFFVCLFSTIGNAQEAYKLTFENNSFKANDKIVKMQVKYIEPQQLGINQLWDFTDLIPVNVNYDIRYFHPDSTQTNLFCGMESNTRYYYRQENDTIESTGYENSTTYFKNTIPELKLTFPFSYGDTLYSPFSGWGQYSHRMTFQIKGYTRIEADAEGFLLLPESPKLRVKAIRVHTCRRFLQTIKDSVEMYVNTYAWYAAGSRYPVLESVKTNIVRKVKQNKENGGSNMAQSNKDTTVLMTSFYYPPINQKIKNTIDTLTINTTDSVVDIHSIFTQARYMPNPVVDKLTISYLLKRDAKVWFSIHNTLGVKLIATNPCTMQEGEHTTDMNMGQLLTGVYSLYVHVDDLVLKVSVIKQ